jgi:hypothetical protein
MEVMSLDHQRRFGGQFLVNLRNKGFRHGIHQVQWLGLGDAIYLLAIRGASS